jgi:hypothetical protein
MEAIMLESRYQGLLIKRLRVLFPGCVILKNDTDYLQGFPDLTILWRRYWAVLEVKASFDAPYEPNQEWYIAELDNMSFSAMICPENEEDVLHDLEQAFQSGG